MSKKLISLLMILSLVWACEDDDNDSPSTSNNSTTSTTATPDAVANALLLPTGSEKVNGSLPAASPQNAPTFSLSDSIFQLQNGMTEISGNFGGVSRSIGGLNIQVEGSSFYYKVPIKVSSASQDSSSGSFNIDLGLTDNVTDNNVVLNINFYDKQKNDLVSQVIQILLEQLKGSGGSGEADFLRISETNVGDPIRNLCFSKHTYSEFENPDNGSLKWSVAAFFGETVNCGSRSGTFNISPNEEPTGSNTYISVYLADDDGFLSKDYKSISGSGNLRVTSSGGKAIYEANDIILGDANSPPVDSIKVSFKITEEQ